MALMEARGSLNKTSTGHLFGPEGRKGKKLTEKVGGTSMQSSKSIVERKSI